ncbi:MULTISPECIES: sigma-70 family RNA polymerase sigma factor [Methylococcus]|uniref:Sigma-70 family RNA polymerase sigma factor n=1 Tax=Methylococcus capsulatus TaxID=414 RepID=A0ABZ2F210_METCP|nr:sigma-70 family RNA polymerase sigma factor [Methylococcus capsulatus]MDF9391959.1 sigma-70 family RNA polymerase sigma factor [Methylococcus capsulatus]
MANPESPEPAAPERWLDEHGDYLFRFALLRVRDESTAEDMVQETLLAAMSAQHRCSGLSSERTWLTGILKHKVVDYLRRSWRERSLDDDPSAYPGEDFGMDELFAPDGHWDRQPAHWGNPYSALEQSQFFEVLRRCIQRLPPRLAHLFVLKEIHDMSNEEICKELEVSATNVWVMLYRARLSLRQCLEYRWFENDREAG